MTTAIFQSGAIISDGHLYEIEPLPDHLHRRAPLEGTGYHVISRRSIQDIPNTAKKSTPVAGMTEGFSDCLMILWMGIWKCHSIAAETTALAKISARN